MQPVYCSTSYGSPDAVSCRNKPIYASGRVIRGIQVGIKQSLQRKPNNTNGWECLTRPNELSGESAVEEPCEPLLLDKRVFSKVLNNGTRISTATLIKQCFEQIGLRHQKLV